MTSIRTTILAATSAALLSATAQSQATLETATTVGAFANTGSVRQSKSRPKGTRVNPSLDITVNPLTRYSGLVGQTKAFRRSWANVVEADLYERGEIVNVTATPGRAGTLTDGNREGAHAFLMRDARPNRRYRIDIAFVATRTTGVVRTLGAVDLNNDLTNEWAASTGTVNKSFNVTTKSAGLSVRITTDGLVSWAAAGKVKYTISLKVKVTDLGYNARCTFRNYGSVCGPVLMGSEIPSGNGAKVQFHMRRGRANAPAVFLLGSEIRKVLIPNTSCYLSVNPVLLLPHATNSRGEAILSFPLPKEFAGSLSVQDIIVIPAGPAFSLQSTHGTTMTCK